jgi:hypothetical protein
MHDANQAKTPKKDWQFLLIYLTVRYSEKPYVESVFLPIQPVVGDNKPEIPWRDFYPELEIAQKKGRQEPGKQWPDDKIPKADSKTGLILRAGGTYSQAVRNLLCDNLMKQYFGIQGPIIVPEEDQKDVFDWADGYMASKGIWPLIGRERWREKLLLSEADVEALDEFFVSDERKDKFNQVLALKTNIWMEPKYYKFFHWATHPYGEDDPIAEDPSPERIARRPKWLVYSPENNLPFVGLGTKNPVIPATSDDEDEVLMAHPRSKKNAQKNTRAQSSPVSRSSSSGTGPKVANRRTVPSVRRVASPGQQQKPTILQLEGEIEKSRVRLDEVLRNADPDLDYVRMLTDRMGKFKADIARLQQEESARLAAIGDEKLGDFDFESSSSESDPGSDPRSDRYPQYPFFGDGGPNQKALEAQNAGDFQEGQDILFGNFPSNRGDGGSLSPILGGQPYPFGPGGDFYWGDEAVVLVTGDEVVVSGTGDQVDPFDADFVLSEQFDLSRALSPARQGGRF